MNKIKMLKNEKKQSLVSIIIIASALLVFICSLFCAYTNHPFRSNILLFVFFMLFIFYGLVNLILYHCITFQHSIQMTLGISLFLTYWGLAVINSEKDHVYINIMLTGLISLIVSLIIWIMVSIKVYCKNPLYKKNSIKKFFLENSGIIIIILLFIILSIDDFNLWFKSDGYTYYSSIKQTFNTWDFSLNDLAAFEFAGHTSFAYTFLIYIGVYITGDIFVGIRLINLLMALFTIYAFAKTLRFLFPRLTLMNRTLLLAIFTFSPLFFGISYEISSDFPTFCFFIWMIYFHTNNLTILRGVSSVFLCFSKETGVILLIAYLTGTYFFKYMANRRYLFKDFLVTFQLKDWLNCFGILCLGVCMIFSTGGWSQEAKKVSSKLDYNSINSITINWNYIFLKLKELYLMNYIWLWGIIVLIAVIFVLRRKWIKGTCSEFTSGIIFSYIAFLLFNFLFFTYIHYRYIQVHIFFLSIFLAWIMNSIEMKSRVKNILMIMLLIPLFIENFITIDPVTLKSFSNINIGRGNIITTNAYAGVDGKLYLKDEYNKFEDFLFLDGLLYNREQIGFEKLIEKALYRINYDENTAIIIPPIYGGTEFTIYSLFGRQDTESFYWNKKEGEITDNTSDIKINFVSPKEMDDNEKSYYYFSFPFDSAKNIPDKYDIDKVYNISYMRWKVTIYKLKD